MRRRHRNNHHTKWLLTHLFSLHASKEKGKVDVSDEVKKALFAIAKQPIEKIFLEFRTSNEGLSAESASKRLLKEGPNEIISEKPETSLGILLRNMTNPFVVLLVVLSGISLILGDINAVIMIISMVLLGVVMRFFQEYRSNKAAAKLKALVSTKATVIRGKEEEISFKNLVPGDIISLSAGDMIPADVRIFYAHDLSISQSSLTGESRPIEKYDSTSKEIETKNVLDLPNICFMGTNVVSGIGKGVVIKTGSHTYFGSIAHAITAKRPLTSFDIGVNKVSFLLIRIMLAMVPVVFVINGLGKGEWFNSLLFALSVAVGLTPEMLPMIVTANLAKGAIDMSKNKVIVKQLNSIQNFGAMDILCTDKTGTLTEDKVVLQQYLNIDHEESQEVLYFAFLNSFYQSGLKNLLDNAILEHQEYKEAIKEVEKVDEIPFDFIRKRMSVVINKGGTKRWLITKGSFDSILHVCHTIKVQKERVELDDDYRTKANHLFNELSSKGLRVLGLAIKELPLDAKKDYHPDEEKDLTFLGFLVFLDPPKQTAKEAIHKLQESGVTIKVLTGDDLLITEKVCEWVGLSVKDRVTGYDLETMGEEEKRKKIIDATVFAKVSPMQKAEIIRIIKNEGHTVGFMGDGINDAPALRESDIGISVDTAVDIAKESSDIIMLEKSLLFLGKGAIEGRKTFANILKYIKMVMSSNFGNVFSILGASLFLPFLPMKPLQLLLQNLLYDISQVAIPFDHVDEEYLEKPRQWKSSGIAKFMFCIGPISSIFDYVTFFVLWFIFQANDLTRQSIFQTGWFMEGLLSQVLVVHMIRTAKIPFIQSFPSKELFCTTFLVILAGLTLPYLFVGSTLGMHKMPGTYFFFLFPIILSYCLLTQMVKGFYIKRFHSWL